MLDPLDAPRIADRYALGPDGVLEGPEARGELGQVWRLRTARGAWAVKEPFEASVEADAREDADFERAARAAGVPTPAVIRTIDGAVLLDLPTAQVRVFEWVDLRERDEGLDPTLVGQLTAAIHQVPFEGTRPVDPWYREPVGADRWDELVEDLTGRGASFAPDLASLRDELVALETLLEPERALRTCHRDLWADNVRATTTGELCVIDWDNFGLADPSQELALVLFEFGAGNPARAASLHAAYREAGGPGRLEAPGSFSMVIAQLGHIGELACRRWLDPNATEADRARAVGRAEEFTTRPLTRATIDELLDAVGDRAT
ncbi:MAG TPA: aminoglycoside phosphotransferase family protein [Actinomycetota bacterium]|nr:aminoglycoside phosphotransferase family protein [Actinomycetota bacterium]